MVTETSKLRSKRTNKPVKLQNLANGEFTLDTLHQKIFSQVSLAFCERTQSKMYIILIGILFLTTRSPNPNSNNQSVQLTPFAMVH